MSNKALDDLKNNKALNDLKGLLGSIAPTLGLALGGPMGGIAGGFISKALGSDPSAVAKDPATISALIKSSSDPSLILKLKESDISFQEFLKTNDLDLEKLAADDRASARSMAVQLRGQDSMTPVLAYGMILFFFVFSFVAFFYIGKLPSAALELASLILGACLREVGAIYAFKFGDTAASQGKTDSIVRAAETAAKR